MKLWQKDKASSKAVEKFTVGRDREMDMYLAPFDVLGSLAHIRMLQSIGLLSPKELVDLTRELIGIHGQIVEGKFQLEEGVEDIHSQVELILTHNLGDVGKKVHSGRSRNDQVLVDIRLYLRHELRLLVNEVEKLFKLLMAQSEKFKAFLLPGYTHLQLAMPSSFGLWFGAYGEALVDDVITIEAAYRVVNKNPLGSAAGYGSSFPLKRQMTTELLGFDSLNYNVVYAQMGRGKIERIAAGALANAALTLAKLAMDACLFMNQNFGFISFPDELTTGSSIMPHKKNPDVFELIRSRCNQISALPTDISLMTANLPSGYHRDLQLLKELLFPAFQSLRDCFIMTHLMVSNVRVRENILEDEKYGFLFSVEDVNRRVLAGVPFRDAYKQVGQEIEEGKFKPQREVSHTHEGSIGNLCTEEISRRFTEIIERFNFAQIDDAMARLLQQ